MSARTVAPVSGAQTRLLASSPDAGNVASRHVSVALHILPPVVDAAAPGHHVDTINHLSLLGAEHWFLFSNIGRLAAVNLVRKYLTLIMKII